MSDTVAIIGLALIVPVLDTIRRASRRYYRRKWHL